LTAAFLAVLHLAILAAGAFRLGRRRGLSADLALFVALVASLNGYVIIWGSMQWFPALASFAWVPWLWWALYSAVGRERGWLGFVPAGLLIYLVITAGYPITVVMCGLLSAWFGLRHALEQKRLLTTWPIMAAWMVGLALSAPAWLMLQEFIGYTLRGQVSALDLSYSWLVPVRGLPGLLFPYVITDWNQFGAIVSRPCSELTGGIVPVAVLSAAACHLGGAFLRRWRWEIGLCVLSLILACSPGIGNFQQSYRWLPLFFLVLGVVAAHGVMELREYRARGANAVSSGWLGLAALNMGIWAMGLTLVGCLYALLMDVRETANLEDTAYQKRLGASLIILSIGWAWIEGRRIGSSALRCWAPNLFVIVACWFTYFGMSMSSYWYYDESFRSPAPFDPSRRYFSVYTFTDYHDRRAVKLLMANSSMYSGLELINGYSPMGPQGLVTVFDMKMWGFLTPESAGLLLTPESGLWRLLESMAVDGLIVSGEFSPDFERLEANGWTQAGSVEGGKVFHRTGPRLGRVCAVEQARRLPSSSAILEQLRSRHLTARPMLLLDEHARAEGETQFFGPAQLSDFEENRCHATVVVEAPSADRESLVVFARPWYPGYRAELDGKPIPVEVFNLLLPAVRIPGGARGRLVLEYRPRSLVVGAAVAAVAAILLLLLIGMAAAQRVPRTRGGWTARHQRLG
jgi:hypothetical protein